MRNEDLEKIFICIKEFIKRVGAIPMAVGGVENHIHILATLPKDKALSDYVRTIKANSSRWIKALDAHYSKFSWQIGYGAFSVSPSHLNKVIAYIRCQSESYKLIL